MRMPATHFAGNLMWTRQGTVYASWSLTPLPAGKSDEDLQLVAQAHTALYRALAGREVMIKGSLVWTDPVAVIARMIDGIDLHQHQSWAEECEQTIDKLAELPLGARRWTLTLPLGAGNWRQKARTIGRAATTDLCDQLQIPTLPPPDGEVDYYRQVAADIADGWPSLFGHRPLTVAEQVWGLRYTQSRGAEELADPFDSPDLAEDLWTMKGRAAAGEPVLDPGGLTDLENPRVQAVTAAIRRRWLKVISDTGAVSYQAGLVLADVPAGGMTSPGGEFLGRIDEIGVPVDVVIRMAVRTRSDGMRRNRRGFTMLADQVDQVEGSQSMASLSAGMQEAARLLVEYNQRLSIDTKEVEVEPVVLLSAAAASAEAVDQLVTDFQQAPGNKDFTWARPVGAESDVFWAMQPGGRLSPRLRDYRHITTGADFAAAAPMMTARLGAAKGSLLGVNTTSPLLSTVHIDSIGESERNFSPSTAWVAELGGGKSYSMKVVCGDEVDRGTVGFAIDGSATREWATFAQSLNASVEIADVENPAVSLDPLRVLPLNRAGPVMQSFLVKLCDFSATSPEGTTLAKVLKPSYLSQHNISSSSQLLAHLSKGSEFALASQIADRIAVFADPDTAGSLADVVFDETLPPLRLTAQMIVVGTHGVKLPTEGELTSAHRYSRLGVDKLSGQAFFLLIAKYAYEVCFRDASQPAMFVVDETWRVTLSEEGSAIVLEFLRDGRKVKASIYLGSHDPTVDFGNETISALIGTKIVLRHRSKSLAHKAVRWLGFDPDERADLVETVQSLSPQNSDGVVPPERAGEGIMVDSMGQFGYLKILPPARPSRAEAVKSTPPSRLVS